MGCCYSSDSMSEYELKTKSQAEARRRYLSSTPSYGGGENYTGGCDSGGGAACPGGGGASCGGGGAGCGGGCGG